MLVGKLTWAPRDSEEGFEGFLVEIALRIFFGMVGHHAGWESKPSWSDEYPGKLREEEIRVCGDGIVEARLTEREKGRVLLWSRLSY